MAQDDVKSIDQLNEEADIAADYLEGLPNGYRRL